MLWRKDIKNLMEVIMNRKEYNDEKWIFPFVEYCPNKCDKKLPLVIQLHGADERGNGNSDIERVDFHGFSELLKKEDFECRVIMPQCPPDSFWMAKTESVLNFIEQLIDKFDTDIDKISLTGMSMGGYGTWCIGMAKPEIFSAIAPVCGGGMAWNASKLTMKIWAFHGAIDDVVYPYHSDEMVEELKKAGRNVKYTKVENVGHDVWDYAYNEELLNWLISQKRIK